MEKRISKAACSSVENVILELFICPIREQAALHSSFKINVPGFLICPQRIFFYWFNQHLAISFEGDAQKKDLTTEPKPEFIHRTFFSEHEKTYVFSAVSGLSLKKESIENELGTLINLEMISGRINRRGFLFSESTFSDLAELGWRIEEFNTTGVILGFQEAAIPVGRSYNFQNIFIFHKSTDAGVSTRHIKWLEVIPYKLEFHENGEVKDIFSSISALQKSAINSGLNEFFIPTSYKQVKFKAINRFIELWGHASTKETSITRFLEEDRHKFIITMHFGAKNIYPELNCFSSANVAIRPDFFVERPNGTCDIVEFKLPRITKPIVVGKTNRRKFSSWFETHLAQAKAYQRHFSSPANREEAFTRHGITVEAPTVTLVIGRRTDVNTPEVRKFMSDYQGIRIISYDELVDGAVAQLYL